MMAKVSPADYRDEVAEFLATFIAQAPAKMSDETRHAAKRALGDSIAVSLGALDHSASLAARRYAAKFPVAGGTVVWGSELRSTPDVAALVNGVLLRCYDYNDFFVGRRNSGHPSDIVAALVVAAEWAGASGEKLLNALAVAYDVTGAAFDAFSTAPGGWDYTNLAALGGTAAFARILDLNAEQTREALAMTVIPHLASDEIESGDLNRRGDLTMWKRFNGSDAARNALQACILASVGVEGAVRPFTGKLGFIAKLQNTHDPVPTLKERLVAGQPLARVADTNMKLWPVGSLAQSAIRAALEARAAVADIAQIKQVRVFVEEGAYDHLVRIRPDPWNPISRETADHSLPYIIAAAVLDGYVRTESFDPDRVLNPARRAFLRDKVTVEPEAALGTIASGKMKRHQDGYLGRVEIEMLDGKVHRGAAKPFPGHPKAPFSDADLEEKIRVNAEPYAGAALTKAIVDMLFAFERLSDVRKFTALLSFDGDAALKRLAKSAAE
jgi:2-methylcitrate dehydratase